jgi:hypothetical protein
LKTRNNLHQIFDFCHHAHWLKAAQQVTSTEFQMIFATIGSENRFVSASGAKRAPFPYAFARKGFSLFFQESGKNATIAI